MKPNTFVIFVLLFSLVTACSTQTTVENSETWGHRGTKPGLFSSPRSVEFGGNEVAVIDRTGRVQFFSAGGEHIREWILEKIDNGTPTALEFDSDGTLWIPDTHNSRILHYTREGKLLSKFGSYGKTDGKFIYPTDLAIGDDGNLYVVEYGNRDRVQVFTKTGEFQKAWGAFGDQKEQFNRPMAIEKGPDGLLYIVDAVNHRVKVYTQKGELKRIIGKEGRNEGEFRFPYDLTIDPQGNLWVLEFGNHRVQQFDTKGTFLQSIGTMGSGPGQLAEPWGVDICHSNLLVADTRNHRIVVFNDIIPQP